MANVLLISYDNESHLPIFPMNIFYLMGALRKKGHNVGVWFQDISHEPNEFLNKLLDQNYFDTVGIGFVAGYYPYRKVKSLSNIINNHKFREQIQFVLGGHGPAGAPEYFLDKMGADAVVVGDGENAICEVVEGAEGVIHAGSVDSYPSLDCYQFFPMDVYRLNRTPTSTRTDFSIPILSSRGCKWNCSFCYRMRDGFHQREVGSILEEITFLHNNYLINYFDFEDELLMASVKRTEEICEGISRLPFKMKWDANGRLNFAKPEILKLMRSSGCEYVNYGIESLNQKILNQMGKGLTVDQINHGVENTLTAKLSPGLNLLWGFPENTEKDLQEEVEFLTKYCPGDELRTIRPVTAYPGCPLFEKGKKDGLVKDPEDFYEHLHVNSDLISINFMDLPNEYAHRVLCEANKELILNYYMKKLDVSFQAAHDLYIGNNTQFRGFRAV